MFPASHKQWWVTLLNPRAWTIDDAAEPPRMFGELMEPEIQMLDIAIFSAFTFSVNYSRSRETHLYWKAA